MTDKDKEPDAKTTTQPEPDKVDLEAIQTQLGVLEAKLQKREEDIAYRDREIERLKEVKKDHDKRIEADASKGDPDAVKKIRDEVASELEKAQKEAEAAQKELRHERVISRAMTKAASYFNDDALEFIELKVSKLCDWEDGEIVVKDDKGEKRYQAHNPRVPMTLDDLFKELASKHKSIAKATYQEGTKQAGHKTNGQATGRKYTPQEIAGMSKAQIDNLINQEKDVNAAKAFLRTISGG